VRTHEHACTVTLPSYRASRTIEIIDVLRIRREILYAEDIDALLQEGLQTDQSREGLSRRLTSLARTKGQENTPTSEQSHHNEWHRGAQFVDRECARVGSVMPSKADCFYTAGSQSSTQYSDVVLMHQSHAGREDEVRGEDRRREATEGGVEV
jgi:hypothetical protein